MYVRIEQIKDTDIVLIIDENDKYLGKMFFYDFVDCIVETKEELEEDEYLFFYVEKETLDKFLIK